MPGRGPKKRAVRGDVSEHLCALADLFPADQPSIDEPAWLPTPLDPASLFASAAPIELEVGCGKGLFLASAAAAHPDRNFLGVELAPGYAHMTAARCVRRNCENARVVSGDATLMIRSLVADQCVQAVHVYFPDPWWKARHRKRRVLCEPFFEQAARILRADGTVHVWTDVEEYFHEAMDAAASTGLFLPPRDVAERAAEHDTDYHTHFERRTRLAEKPVWRAELDRSEQKPPARQPITSYERIRLLAGSAPESEPDHSA
ncbi:MAG: tRNA (guanosine(46)-N7)-methyltransferase TrmB [Pirellulales bacterium]|jgi:tRNA (guanine-N7-)-methyltransferase|nr:tRNA (guanosine(46)-N7)-methyltransferase TrmB [Pirellulales bacterium]